MNRCGYCGKPCNGDYCNSWHEKLKNAPIRARQKREEEERKREQARREYLRTHTKKQITTGK
jgi:hypothetical protein